MGGKRPCQNTLRRLGKSNPRSGIAPVQNEIPAVAYTGAETDIARKTKELPARVAASQPLLQPSPPPTPPSPPTGPSAYVDTIPHYFWPQVPWLPESGIDPLHTEIFSPTALNVRHG
jgi:hypothetical protein